MKVLSRLRVSKTGSEAKDWIKTFVGMTEINKWSDTLKIESIYANLSGQP